MPLGEISLDIPPPLSLSSLGRRVIFYVCILVTVGFRMVTVFSSDYFILFAITCVIDSLGSISIFQGPLVIAMEISNPYVVNRIRSRVSRLKRNHRFF